MRSDYKSARAGSLVKKYNLSKQQRRVLHNEVSHQGYDYHEIEELIKKMFNK